MTDWATLSRWLMPTDDFEARVGQAFTFRAVPVKGPVEWDGVVHCTIRELVVGQRLSWTWTSNALGVETLVTITLQDLGGRTRLAPEHTGWEGLSPEKHWLIDEHNRGWVQLLARGLKPNVEAR